MTGRCWTRATLGVAALAAVAGLTGCGTEPSVEASRVASSRTTPDVTASTPTTTSTTSTTTTTTMPATTTTVAGQRTVPIAPPADPYGPEDNPPLGWIAIPSIGLDAVLQQGIREASIDRGPSHWPGSAMPGEIGNVVIAGHRTSRGAEFYRLDQLVPGDTVVFTTATGAHEYVVTATQIVTPDALWITDPSDTATATLFACHPLGSTAERIVVHLDLATT